MEESGHTRNFFNSLQLWSEKQCHYNVKDPNHHNKEKRTNALNRIN